MLHTFVFVFRKNLDEVSLVMNLLADKECQGITESCSPGNSSVNQLPLGQDCESLEG